MANLNEGFVLVCNSEGRIISYKCGKSVADFSNIENKLFIELFVTEVVTKALDFLVEIKTNNAAFGTELILKPEFTTVPFFFSGVLIDCGISIFGFPTQLDYNKFLAAMAQINSEQTNLIRALEKRLSGMLNGNSKGTQIFEDLTLLNNELINTQRELTKKNLALINKNQFLGMVAHDLKNPIGNINDFCGFLERSMLSSIQAEYVEGIRNLTEFMNNLVSDLFNVSEIESGNIKLNLEPIDVVGYIRNNIKRNSMVADKKQIKIIFHSELESFMAYIDKNKFEQILSNLIVNAIKYSLPYSEVEVSFLCDESNMIISVKDQGQGIKPTELNVFFKPFQQAIVNIKQGEQGIGLGLLIAKKMVELHDGKIWVDSKLYKGSSFYFSLPLTEIKN